MWWVKTRERGAVAVLVAIMMTVLLGFVAFGVDVANMASDKQQLQNGADAAALAIAQDCALENSSCSNSAGDITSDSFAAANRLDGAATGVVLTPSLNPATGEVTVRATGTTEHWFAQFLGIGATDINAEATAVWEPLSGGNATLPLAISLCEIDAMDQNGIGFTFVDGEYTWIGYTPPANAADYEVVIYLSKTTDTEYEVDGELYSCHPEPSGNWLPGGFGWLDSTECSAEVDADGSASSDTGVDVPNDCSVEYLRSLVGTVVPLPVFDQATVAGTGTNATYHILGFVGFHVTGYSFVGQYKENAPCGGNDRCISGYFDELVTEDTGAGGADTDLGARGIKLVLP